MKNLYSYALFVTLVILLKQGIFLDPSATWKLEGKLIYDERATKLGAMFSIPKPSTLEVDDEDAY